MVAVRHINEQLRHKRHSHHSSENATILTTTPKLKHHKVEPANENYSENLSSSSYGRHHKDMEQSHNDFRANKISLAKVIEQKKSIVTKLVTDYAQLEPKHNNPELNKKISSIKLDENTKLSQNHKKQIKLSDFGNRIGTVSDFASAPANRINAEQLALIPSGHNSNEEARINTSTPTSAPSSYGNKATLLTLGLPLLSCALLIMMFCLILRYCRRLKQLNKEKASSIGKQSSNSFAREHLANAPVSLISGGKVLSERLNSIQILANHHHHHSENDKLDKRHLTIDMESSDSSHENSNVGVSTSKHKNTFNGRLKQNFRRKKRQSQKDMEIKQLGQLKYMLSYDFTQSTFSVSILEAKNLPGMDLSGLSDPFVRVSLYPDYKRFSEKTQIHRKTLNPVFNETFQFKVAYADLMQMTLVLTVYDYDRFSRSDEIGQISVPINSIDMAQSQEVWQELRARSNDTKDGQVSRK